MLALLRHHSKDGLIGALRGSHEICVFAHEQVLQTGQHLCRGRAIRIHVSAEDIYIGLRAAQNDGVDRGDANAAAKIANEIEQAGGVAHGFLGNWRHADGRVSRQAYTIGSAAGWSPELASKRIDEAHANPGFS